MELSNDDGILVFMGIALLVISLVVTGVGFYHYGYYEGKAVVLESLRPKPEPAQ